MVELTVLVSIDVTVVTYVQESKKKIVMKIKSSTEKKHIQERHDTFARVIKVVI